MYNKFPKSDFFISLGTKTNGYKSTGSTAIFEKHFKEWESNEDRMASGHNYESTYADMMGKIEKEVLQISVGTVPKDKNLKKNSIPDLEK